MPATIAADSNHFRLCWLYHSSKTVYPTATSKVTGWKMKEGEGDVELFDAAFFGYNPRSAELTEPQHRVFLETAWEAMEIAGYDTGEISLGDLARKREAVREQPCPRVGVVLGLIAGFARGIAEMAIMRAKEKRCIGLPRP